MSENAATVEPPAETKKPAPETPKREPKPGAPVDHLPQWKVILHNDDVNNAFDVIKAIIRITFLSQPIAYEKTVEAHKTGVSVLLTTHQEKAELIMEQFGSCRPPITVTIEKDA